MKLAVMQPYLFPYLGYYQLVNAVDKFVFYDDVTFIKGGYINRNNILANGKAQRFTIPVKAGSSNKLINELKFDDNVTKALKSIEQHYKKSSYFNEVFPIIHSVLTDENRCVGHICSSSVISIFNYLGINKEFYSSSEIEYDRKLSAANKLIEMSNVLGARDYINSPGGRSLYDKEFFSKNDINLSFIDMLPCEYLQSNSTFVPNLSIIDVLMWNSKSQVISLLDKYRLS